MTVSCLCFLALGVISVSLGPALPDLANATASSLAAVGGVFTALFLGALLSQVVAGPIHDRFGQLPVLLGGSALLAGGILGASFSHSLLLLFLMIFITGLGHGGVDLGSHLLVARLYPKSNVAALNLLNLSYGVGAVSGPAIASLFLRQTGSAIPALWVGAAAVIVQMLLVPVMAAPRHSTEHHAAAGASKSVLTSPLLWGIGALLLMYVGVETGLSGWSTTYLERSAGYPTATAALVTSGFWAAITVGRLVVVMLGSRFTPQRLLAISTGVAVCGGLLLGVSVGNGPVSVAAILLVGLAFGPVFPTTIALTTTSFPHNPGTATSAAVAASSLGGMLLPAFQGLLLDRFGTGVGAWFVTVGTVALLGLLLALLGIGRRREAVEA
jgi:fucose permease